MRTVCSFPGCKTGTNAERIRNKVYGIRNKALFAFPRKDPQLRRKWEDVIGRQSKDNEVICELHFHKTDIQTEYVTKLSDGIEHRMNRLKALLKSTAIPQLVNPHIPCNQPPESVTNTSPSHEEDTELFIGNNYCDRTSVINEEQQSSAAISLKIAPSFSSIFSLEKIDNQLKNGELPKGWSHILLEKFLIIAHWATNTPSKKELHVHTDGSVQVLLNRHVTKVPGIKPGTSVGNLLDNLKLVQSLLLCDGTGIMDRYSGACKRFVNPVKSSIRHGSVRCSLCQKLRKKLVRLESQCQKTSSRQQVRSKENKRKLKNQIAKNRRLKNQLKKLKAEVMKAKKKCALASGKIIDEKIAKLPPEQQEALSAMD